MKQKKRALVMAGGTGGHIYPALACAQEFQQRGYEVLWLGSKNSMEEKIVPQYGFQLKTIAIKGVRGKGIAGLVFAPFRIAQAIAQAFFIMLRFKPNLVLGMGGFVAGPGGVAAKLSNVPLIIHEQNAVAGTTNKLLAQVANQVLQAFPNVLRQGKTIGNPVRGDIAEKVEKTSPEKRKTLNLLVVGGSLGAQYINRLLPDFIQTWQHEIVLNVWHQAGNNNFEEVQATYKELGIEVNACAYIENMDAAYQWADLVLCRAGAMTVSELAIVGLPAILIPFPYAIDDHQTANAMQLVNAGAAIILQQTELTATRLQQEVSTLLDDEKILANMGQAAQTVAYPQATNDVVNECERLIKNDK